jgi:hypothetical protein
MTVQRPLVVCVVAAAAIFALAATPVAIFGVSAQAQSRDGKVPGGPNRAEGPGKSNPPKRSAPPTINRTATPRPAATVERSGQARDARINRDATPNRTVRDADRSRGEGEGRRGDSDRRRGTRYTWGPGLVFYFYDGFYHGDCSWLRRKARETGSRYWRQRYEQCRD